MDLQLFEAVDRYIGDLLVAEDEALRAVGESIAESGMPQISVSPAQGKLLHILALLCNARSILELGTLGGYSTIWMGRALPPGGRLITIEADPRYADVATRNLARAGLEDRVEVRVGRALDLLPRLDAEGAGPFDMIFIDADKPPYAEYLRWSIRLARPGSLIVADNVVREGAVLDGDSKDERVKGIRRFNEELAANPAVTATIVQSVGVKGYDGMAIALVR
jgi:caffeoyl-CoA O-methyltransferase